MMDGSVGSTPNYTIPRPSHFIVPPHPAGFVPRPELYERALQILCSDLPEDGIPPRVVLQGGGGFGKMTLARALCNDPIVWQSFPDGILWIHFNEDTTDGELLRNLEALIAELGHEQRRFNQLEGAVAHLRELLKEKKLLIVLDDVWQTRYLEPMTQSSSAAFLITSRLLEAAMRAKGKRVEVAQQLTVPQGVEILGAGQDIPKEILPRFENLVERMQGWALMLVLTNKALVMHVLRGSSVKSALEKVEIDLYDEGFTAFDSNNPEERNDAISLSLSVSLRLLEARDAERYEELSIFKRSEWVPLSTLGQLWIEYTDRQVQQLCEEFCDLALVDYDPEHEQVCLHDVFSAVLSQRLPKPERETRSSASLHRLLLRVWERDEGWNALPDKYAWDHYVYHLHGAGRDEALRALFIDQRWMNARFEHDDYTYTGFIEDVMLVWEQVAQPTVLAQLDADQDVTALADCMRYALIRTSINSLAGNYVPAIVARAVVTGVWKIERALSIAQQIPDAVRRVEMYAKLLETKLNDQ